jgi:hypothetical protein
MLDIAGNDMTWITKLPEDSIPGTSALLQELIGLESVSTDLSEEDAHAFGYRPYALGAFGALLQVAVQAWSESHQHASPQFLLEVGCGIGTKLVLAAKVFHLQAEGFDASLKYVQAASDLCEEYAVGLGQVWREDARYYQGWNSYDIIFLNRPLRDYQEQLKLEETVYDEMSMGSVLILGNALSTPDGWKLLARGVAAAVFQKVCKCDGVEELLHMRDQYFGTSRAVCNVCGRAIEIPGEGYVALGSGVGETAK